MKKLFFIILLASTLCSAQTVKIAQVGANYNGKDSIKFRSDIHNFTYEDSIRLWQRWQQWNYIQLSYKNSWKFTESTAWDGGTCSPATQQKINTEVNSYHIPKLAGTMVFIESICGGSGSGGAEWFGGTCYHDSSSGLTMLHEKGHWLGFGHNSILMNSSTNHGSAAWNVTWNAFEFAQIDAFMDRVAGKMESPTPTITIDTANTHVNGSSAKISAKVTGLVEMVYITVDGISKGALFYWGTTEKNQWCNPKDGVKYFIGNLSSGTHTVTMTAKDFNNKIAEATATLIIK